MILSNVLWSRPQNYYATQEARCACAPCRGDAWRDLKRNTQLAKIYVQFLFKSLGNFL